MCSGLTERTIGYEIPPDSFSHLKYLTAAPADFDAVAFFSKISAAKVSPSDRKTARPRTSRAAMKLNGAARSSSPCSSPTSNT